MKFVKWIGAALAVIALLLVAGFAWASSKASSNLSRTVTAHSIELASPMPLSDAELDELRAARAQENGAEPAGEGEETDPLAGTDLEALALERALARGKHLVEARFVCVECHGKDFSGGVMVDDPAIGSMLGPNLTLGKGSVVADYTMADWDRIVRHGIKKNGRPAFMPSEDFVNMSDRELSDIITYIKSRPPVDNEVPASFLGPVGKVLMATGKFPLSVDSVKDHQAAHTAEPPATEVSVEFGKHLSQVCTGCHRHNFEGGPIAIGPPSWPPAGNLTPHADGLSGWTFEQFTTVLREGKRPDGTAVKEPMTLITPYAEKMTETELQALWKYLQSTSPVPKGL